MGWATPKDSFVPADRHTGLVPAATRKATFIALFVFSDAQHVGLGDSQRRCAKSEIGIGLTYGIAQFKPGLESSS